MNFCYPKITTLTGNKDSRGCFLPLNWDIYRMEARNEINGWAFNKKLQWPLVLAPVVVYFSMLLIYEQNTPFGDDFYLIAEFLIKFFQPSANFQQKINLLFAPMNGGDYRPFTPRLEILLSYALMGKPVNFLPFIFYGNLCLAVFAYLIYLNFRFDNKIALLAFAPFCWLLFQLQYYVVTYWSTACLINLQVIMLNFLALHLLNKGGIRNILLALAVSFFGVYTSASAMLVFPFGLWIIWNNKTNRLVKVVWAIALLGICISFFINNPRPASNLALVLAQPMKFLQFNLYLIGSAFMYTRASIYVSQLVGALVIVWVFYLFFSGYAKREPFLFSCLAFSLMVCILISFGRINYGLKLATNSRNKIYSLITIGFVYLTTVSYLKPGKRLLVILLVNAFCILFYVLTASLDYGFIKNWHQNRIEPHKKVPAYTTASNELKLANDFLRVYRDVYNSGLVSEVDSASVIDSLRNYRIKLEKQIEAEAGK